MTDITTSCLENKVCSSSFSLRRPSCEIGIPSVNKSSATPWNLILTIAGAAYFFLLLIGSELKMICKIIYVQNIPSIVM